MIMSLNFEEKVLTLIYYARHPEFQKMAVSKWYAGIPERDQQYCPPFDPDEEPELLMLWEAIHAKVKLAVGTIPSLELRASIENMSGGPALLGSNPNISTFLDELDAFPQSVLQLERGKELFQRYLDDNRVVVAMRGSEGKDATLKDYLDAFKSRYAATRLDGSQDPLADHLSTADNIIKKFKDPEGPKLKGPPTGFQEIDDATAGLRKKAVWLVDAMPGAGKTTFMLQVACWVASQGYRVLFITLEQEAEALWNKVYAALAEIDSRVLDVGVKRANMEPYVARIEGARARISAWKGQLRIMDAAALGGEEAMTDVDVSVIQDAVQEFKPDLVVVDYLQLVGDVAAKNEFEAVGRVIKAMQRLAARENICVMAASAQNRAAYDSKKSLMNDSMTNMRGSSFLEYAATVSLKLTPDLDEIPEEVATARDEQAYRAQIDELAAAGVTDKAAQKFAIRMDDWSKQTISTVAMTMRKNKYGPLCKILLKFNKSLSRMGTNKQENLWKTA